MISPQSWSLNQRTLCVFFLVLLFNIACTSDDNVSKPQVRFFVEETLTTEAADSVVVELSLSKPAKTESYVYVELDPGSTATLGQDFLFNPLVSFTKGGTRSRLVILPIDDAETEGTESINLIMSTVTGVEFDDRENLLRHAITLSDNDVGLTIDLSWDAGDGTPGDVDMDLLLWVENPPGSGTIEFVTWSAFIGTAFESVTLPGNAMDGQYYVTFNYYEGTSDNLTFTVDYSVAGGTIDGATAPKSFMATYTLSNVNCCSAYQIEQAFTKSGTDFNTFSEVFIPSSGSRISSLIIPEQLPLKKQ